MDTQTSPEPDDIPGILKPGPYTAVYEAHRGMMIFRTPKLEVQFRLLEHPAIVLSRWYRVTTFKNRISAPVQSDVVREIQAVLNRRVRNDRIPLELLKGVVVSVDVKLVTTDKEQKSLASINYYNVIGRVAGRLNRPL
jgi:hypothetical protein